MTIKGDTVTVIAPATLNEGYTFDVTVDGKSFAVVVPPGGVNEGQTFEAIVVDPALNPPAKNPEIVVEAVPESEEIVSTTSKTIVNNPDGSQTITEETFNPDGSVTKTVTTVAAGSVETGIIPQATALSSHTKASRTPAIANTVPTGAWRYDICSCFDVCCNGMFWMSWCCTYIAMGQLLQRLKLNVCGQPGDYKNTCMIWTILWCVAFTMYWIIVAATEGYGIFLYYALAIFALVALSQARYFVRTKWSIPADCCEGSGCLSDCCCVIWCNCCSIIQMMRHTHDEEVDRYSCGTATGLDAGAADVV